MDAARFRQLALAFPEATEGRHRGHPDFRVRDRIFATLNDDETAGHLRCDPLSLDRLVQEDPTVFRDAWGGRWLGIDLARAQEDDVLPLMEDAWRAAAPKTLTATFTREE